MNENSKESEPPYSTDPVRQRLLRRMVTASTIVVAICYPLTLLRTMYFGFATITVIQTVLFCFMVGVFFARDLLGLQVAAGSVLLAILVWILTAVGNYGVFAPAHLLVPYVVILSSLLFGRTLAYRLLGLLIVGLGLIGALFLAGTLHYQLDVRWYARSWTPWVYLLTIQTAVAFWYLFLIAPLNDVHRHLAERLEAVLDGINDAVLIHDKDSGAILQVNQKMCAMYGCSSEEALRANVSELSAGIAPYDPASARAWMMKAVDEGPQMFEWQAKDRQGRLFWVEVNMRPVQLDGAQRLLAVVRDISARKQVEEDFRRVQSDLWESEVRFNTAFRFMPVGAGITTVHDGRFLAVNKHFRDVFGYTEAELVGHTAGELGIWANPEDRAHVVSMLAKGQAVYAYECPVRRKDGSLRWVAYSGDLVVLGGVEYLLSGAIDITERKRAQEAELEIRNRLNQAQKMEAIGTLAGGIAHDFNNILGAIIGYTDLALTELPEASPVRELLENVALGGARAVDLARQILAFSRQIPLDRKPIQPVLAVKEALKLLRASLPATIAVRERLESSSWVLADAGQVHQIVMNLCANAGLAMRESGGELDVRLHELDSDAASLAKHKDVHPGRYVCLTVSDTGCGIPPDNLGRIFDPFFTTRPVGEGTGLGLSVVHGIVAGWGGSVYVASEVGRGTTFEILLPVCDAPAKVESEPNAPSAGSERVLVVDDEIDLTDVASRGLRRLGYDVVVFNDPAKAIEAFRARPKDFDIVVTDMTMPRITGDVLAAEVRRIRPEIPVAVVSGFSDRFTAEKARVASFDGFVDKPLRPTALAQLVRRLCDQRAGSGPGRGMPAEGSRTSDRDRINRGRAD